MPWTSRSGQDHYLSLAWTVSTLVAQQLCNSYCISEAEHNIFYYTENKSALCELYLSGKCVRGAHCPFRHYHGERTVVCKHWLRHLCKKGDDCEFLHEYDMAKMPPCYFFQKFGECNNKDCQYIHADNVKTHDCAWYDRGFCKHGNCYRT